MSTRGYVGIGILNPKTEQNIGTLWRSAHAFGADFIFVVGARYRRQASDTTKAENHIPLYEYESLEDMTEHLPKGCQVVPIEIGGRIDLAYAKHPERAVYLLGPEDGSIPPEFIAKHALSIEIGTALCLNVATAGSLVLYDRYAKTLLAKQGVRGLT
jgi:tRNA(Leu) C34 or U34 (ribose-2'-O)-methylase TrmL